jgi:hypothetical protein
MTFLALSRGQATATSLRADTDSLAIGLGGIPNGMTIKIGKMRTKDCGVGIHGSNVEVGDAEFINTGVAVMGNELPPPRYEPTAASVPPSRGKRTVKAVGRFFRDVSAATLAAVIGSSIKPN